MPQNHNDAVPSPDDLRASILADPAKHNLRPIEAKIMSELDDEVLAKALRDAAAEDTVVGLAVVRLDRELTRAAMQRRIDKLRSLGDRMWQDGPPESNYSS